MPVGVEPLIAIHLAFFKCKKSVREDAETNVKMKLNVAYIMQGVQVLFCVFMLVLTLLPVELHFTDADVWQAYAVSAACAAGTAIMLAGRRKLALTWIDAAVALWAAYAFGRAYVGDEWPCSTQLMQMGETLLLYCALRVLFGNKCAVSPWCLVAGFVACAGAEALMGVWQMACGTSRHYLYAVTGSFLNPGPYSAYLMLGAVVALAALESASWQCDGWDAKWMRVAKIGMTAVCGAILVVLPAAWSRSALVGAGVCALWIFRNRYRKYKWQVWCAMVIVLIGAYFIKQGSADGRVAIWAASLASWQHSPWLGVGIGGFRHACAEGMAELWHDNPASPLFDSAGVTDYAYNELLKILVEQGVAGAFMCAALVVLVMRRLYGLNKPLFAGMFALALFSMFSYPFELQPYRVIVVLASAWCASSQLPQKENKEMPPSAVKCSAKWWTVAWATALAISGCGMAREISRRVEADEDIAFMTNISDLAFADDCYELLPDAADNPQFLFSYGKMLRDGGRYRDSSAILRMGTKVSADPMFYVLIGNNYRDERFHDLAEKAYEKAFSIMPNRLYPKYQMMLMYGEMKETGKCRDMARQVMAMKPKVESAATKEMRRRAMDILNKR